MRKQTPLASDPKPGPGDDLALLVIGRALAEGLRVDERTPLTRRMAQALQRLSRIAAGCEGKDAEGADPVEDRPESPGSPTGRTARRTP
jgi:hypothetical protein